MRNTRILFIVGVPRSGTTLLKSILSAHSRIAIAPETHFFQKFYNRYGDPNKDSDFERLWSDLKDNKYFLDLGLSNIQSFKHNLLQDRPRTYQKIYTQLLREYAGQKGKEVCGDETPGHFEFIDLLASFYPEAKFIHIIRDPRAVAASFAKTPWGAGRSHFQNAKRWARYIRASARHKQEMPDTYLEIRYEDLVIRPVEVIKKVCNFIGVDHEDQMSDFYQIAGSYLSASEPWKDNCLKPIAKENIDKWKKDLYEKDDKVISLAAGKYMREYGYEPASRINLIDRCRYLVQAVRFYKTRVLRTMK